MANRAQNIVELYGVLPTIGMMSTFNLFLLRPASQPEALDWPVPWTKMVELKSRSILGASKAFMSILAEVSLTLWTPMLSGCRRRWAGC